MDLSKILSDRISIRQSMLLLMGLGLSLSSIAQKDTTRKPSINIVSAFKPVIRNPAKINFSGSQLNADTSKSVRAYNIPAQNLFYSYQAVSQTALALEQDTTLYLGSRNFVKAGFGNLTTPYLKFGLGIGDGRAYLLNAYGSYISSNGNIKNQDYSKVDVKVAGSYFLPRNEVYASVSTSRDQYYLYGYNHSLLSPKRSDISQQFQQINLTGGIRNTNRTQYRINYDPNFQVNFFSSKNNLSETSFSLNIPVEKKFGDDFTFKLDAKVDLTRYSTANNNPTTAKFSNNVTQIGPSVVYNTSRLLVNAGIIPLWNNGEFDYLPNLFAEAQLKEKVFMVQAGWVGRINKNTYRNLTTINPYLAPLTSQTNTREMEFYGGIKATVGKHFNFNAKAGIVHYENFALFVNDNSGGAATENRFKIVYEPKMENLRIHGDLSYIHQEKFSATAGLTLNGYTGVNVNDKAWNTVPMEFTGSMRWWVMKELLLKGDFYLFGGGKYLGLDNKSHGFSGGSDLSAGAEFKITRQFGAFLDVNNIFDNKYERWHNYPVYGLNLVAGLSFQF